MATLVRPRWHLFGPKTTLDHLPSSARMKSSVNPAVTALYHDGLVIDEALKAGIAVTACSTLVLVAVLLGMLVLPVNIG
jgi:hypothetical protein